MNALSPLPSTTEATKVASRPWHVVLRPLLNVWEPVVIKGKLLAFEGMGLAVAAASGIPGAKTIDMGRSPFEPSLERIREVANQGNPPEAAVLHIEDMDPLKEAARHQAAQGPLAAHGGWR